MGKSEPLSTDERLNRQGLMSTRIVGFTYIEARECEGGTEAAVYTMRSQWA